MKPVGWTLLVGIAGLIFVAGADAVQTIRFPRQGFSIAPLEAPVADSNRILITMYLTASDGFAPNVNILTQSSPDSIDQYIAISKQGWDKRGWKIIKADKLDNNTCIFECSGSSGKNQIHTYAKASLKGSQILLATATATEVQWAADGTQLQACVDSFQRDAQR